MNDVLIGRQRFADATLGASVGDSGVPVRPPHAVKDIGHLIHDVRIAGLVLQSRNICRQLVKIAGEYGRGPVVQHVVDYLLLHGEVGHEKWSIQVHGSSGATGRCQLVK